MWELHAPANGVNDAPAALHRSLRKNFLSSAESLAKVGLRFRVSSIGPFLYFDFRKEGEAVGAPNAGTDDILGLGEQDVPTEIRVFLEYRLGAMEAQ